jgi:hypothetical protein
MSTFQFVAYALGLPTGPAGAPETPAAAPKAIPAADQPTKEQLIQLFEVLRLTPLFQAANAKVPDVIKANWNKIEANYLAENPPWNEEREAIADQVANQVATTIYPLSAMESDIAGVYQSFLSADDVAAAIAFFSSSAGQNLLNSQPAMLLALPVVVGNIQQLNETGGNGALWAALTAALGK